jgi:PAS domain-containing protein
MSGPLLAPLAALPFGAAVLDAAGSVFALNDAFAELAGRDVLDLVAKPFVELISSGPLEADFVASTFGSRQGSFRIRIGSFDLGGDRRALVVVEEVSEVRRLRAVESAYDLALERVAQSRHGINNSLMGIIGYLELLASQAGVPEAIRKRVEILLTEAGKIRDRVAELALVRRS